MQELRIRPRARKLMVFALLLVVLHLLAPCTAVEARDRTVFALGTGGLINYPLYVALGAKLFERYDVDAQIVVLKGGAAAIAAVVSGDAHVYVGSPALALRAREKKQQLKIFATLMDQIGSNIVLQGDIADRARLSASSTTEERIRALKGLRIAVSGSGSTTDLILRSMVSSAGLRPDQDLTIAPIGAEGILPAFANRRIDGFILSPPAAETAILRHGGRSVLNIMKGEYPPLRGFLFMTLVAADRWLDSNRELAVRIVRALWDAQRLIGETPEMALRAASIYFDKVEPEILAASADAVRAAIPHTPRIARAGIMANFEFMRAMEHAGLEVEPAVVFTNDFVDRAEALSR